LTSANSSFLNTLLVILKGQQPQAPHEPLFSDHPIILLKAIESRVGLIPFELLPILLESGLIPKTEHHGLAQEDY